MNKKTNTGKRKTASKKVSKKIIQQDVVAQDQHELSLEPLMPELNELVKKNPNRLIGCGG